MNFKLWLEGEITEETKKRIYQKITTVGMPVRRGTRPRYHKEFASDPGDLGRGIYYDTNYHRAKNYGDVTKTTIKFKNPIILTAQEAYKLSAKFGTVKLSDDEIIKFKSPEDRINRLLNNAQALTDYMIKLKHDGLVCIHHRNHLEIVDYRPYIKEEPYEFQ